MITIDLSLKGLLHGNVFNFLIVFGLIIFLLIKMDVSNALENAKNKILELINKSEEDKSMSEKAFDDAKKDVENLPFEKEKIQQETQNTIESYKNKTQAEIDKTAEKLENNAQKIIDNETLRINASLQKELVVEALDVAHNKTLENLKNNHQLHRQFIAEAIDKIEEIEIK